MVLELSCKHSSWDHWNPKSTSGCWW